MPFTGGASGYEVRNTSVPADALDAKDWDRVQALASEAAALAHA